MQETFALSALLSGWKSWKCCVKPWACVRYFLSESDHRHEGCLAIMALELVLDKLNLVLVRMLVVSFPLKKACKKGSCACTAWKHSNCHSCLGCLLLIGEGIGSVLCLPFVVVLFLV